MNTSSLPETFLKNTAALLGEEMDAFLASYGEMRWRALRVNTLKLAPADFAGCSPFALRQIPWIEGGNYIDEEDGAGRHPFYYAGLYYLQEPSAMTPAAVLDARPGERVLDLCAAPGGKATALGAALRGEGLLVANDISASRCRALLKNIEVFGIPNAVITNEVPARLAQRFTGFFDKVLVDAPCSGEGMFRKDEAVIRAWYPQKPAECAKIQKDLILRAADMLCDGGRMVYSTCTFNALENEAVIAYLLRERPQMRLLPIPRQEGFAEGIAGASPKGTVEELSAGEETAGLSARDAALCLRLWPHKVQGEGHFIALLGKGEESESGRITRLISTEKAEKAGNAQTLYSKKNGKGQHARACTRSEADAQFTRFMDFCREMGITLLGSSNVRDRLYLRREQLFLAALPERELAGINCVRDGLLLGTLKKDRFEPSQALAMAISGIDDAACVDLSADSPEVIRYLKGETLTLQEETLSERMLTEENPLEKNLPGKKQPEMALQAGGLRKENASENKKMTGAKGWKLVRIKAGSFAFPLGWAKQTGSLLKNKYLAGWRMS